MSFWEDRFVDRPHASAIPANEPADLDAPDTSADPNGLPEGRAWSDVSEPDADVGAQQPFGFGYRPSEETPDEDMRDEEPTEDAEADESPAVEYRRAGILRRRRPVPVDAEAEVEAVAEGALEVARDLGVHLNQAQPRGARPQELDVGHHLRGVRLGGGQHRLNEAAHLRRE